MNPKPRFLIFRGGAIGDFIVTLPALHALRRQWPECHVELAGYPHIADLALAGGIVDRVVSLEKAETAEYFSMRPTFSEAQKEYVQSFDVVISYLYDPSGIVRENLLAAGEKQVIYASPLVQGGHATDHLMRPLVALAIFPEAVEYARLVLDPARVGKGKERLRRIGDSVVAIHPGSGSPKKNWPLEKFVALAVRLLSETRWKPVFILGEADDAIAEALARTGSRIPVLERGSLVELAGTLSACAGYVGNDSGITQLAAAVGIPVVCLFGPTDPAVWAPRGPNARVLAAPQRTTESLAAIEAEPVFASLVEMIPEK